jgi:hypothetical protein
MGVHSVQEERLAWWRLVAVGWTIEDAAAECGMALSTARYWFVKAGGVIPRSARPGLNRDTSPEP